MNHNIYIYIYYSTSQVALERSVYRLCFPSLCDGTVRLDSINAFLSFHQKAAASIAKNIEFMLCHVSSATNNHDILAFLSLIFSPGQAEFFDFEKIIYSFRI